MLGLSLNGSTVIGADGQVTVGTTVMKQRARKVRKLHHDRILAGFAGSTADAFALAERTEDARVRDAALELRRRIDPARPYFLWVHYFDPHYPYAPPEPFRTKYAARLYAGEVAAARALPEDSGTVPSPVRSDGYD